MPQPATEQVWVPTSIQVPSGDRLETSLHVPQGVQVYECENSGWVNIEPHANMATAVSQRPTELLRATSDVVDLAAGPWQAHRRLITSVRTETRLLGIIWVAEGSQPLPPQAARALRDVLRHQEEHSSKRRRGGALVRALLNGQGTLHRQAD